MIFPEIFLSVFRYIYMNNKCCAVTQELDLSGYINNPKGVAMISANALRNGQLEATRLAVQKLCLSSINVSESKPSEVVLGSSSPRRLEIMTGMSLLPVKVSASECEEHMFDGLSNEAQVQNIAVQKMLAVITSNNLEIGKQSVVLTSDTMIHVNGQLTGKINREGRSSREMYQELTRLLGGEIAAVTAYCLFDAEIGRLSVGAETASVKFRPSGDKLSEAEISFLRGLSNEKGYEYLKNVRTLHTVDDVLLAYFASGKYKGKAGGFGIQDREFFVCISKLQGDPFVVVGLPVNILRSLMTSRSSDIDLIKGFWPSDFEALKLRGN